MGESGTQLKTLNDFPVFCNEMRVGIYENSISIKDLRENAIRWIKALEVERKLVERNSEKIKTLPLPTLTKEFAEQYDKLGTEKTDERLANYIEYDVDAKQVITEFIKDFFNITKKELNGTN